MNRTDKIYVAGHNGMVGSSIFRLLNSNGYKNVVVKSSRELDLRESTDVDAFLKLERPDYVFLAAAKVGGIEANSNYRADFLYDNLMIQNNVIHSAHNYGVKRLQFLGSSCIYPKKAPQPLKEEYLLTGPLEPTNEPYAIAKIAGIKLCEAYRDQYGSDFHSVMPTNLYGPNDNYDLEKSHVLPALIRKFHLAKLLENGDKAEISKDLGMEVQPFYEVKKHLMSHGILHKDGVVSVNLWGSGRPFREFLHVEDLAKACLLLMKRGLNESFINVGFGKDIGIQELALIVRKIVGFRGSISWDSSKPDGTAKKLMNVEKIFRLGWEPQISLSEGILSVYNEYKNC
jgi:GDP-L-fucose synthase